MGGSRTRCSTTVARSFQSYRPHPFSSCLAVSAIDGISVIGIERKLDVGICAIKDVGDNGGKPCAPTFEDLM
jgi:hypothetical protein